MSTTIESDRQADAIDRLRRSFDDGLAGHAVAAADGRLLACNPEFARIIGTASIEEAMAVNLHELEPQPGALEWLLGRLRESPLIPLEEVRLVRRDGATSHVLARLAATLDADGQLMEIRVYLVDITDRFRNEERLRASAEQHRLALLATQDVLWDWNVPAATITWSDAAARRLRYSADEVRNAIDWHAGHIHPDDRERVIRGVERAILGIGNEWSDEYRLRRGDGTYATVYDRAYIVRDDRGEPLRVVGSILDITELRMSEESHRFLAGASAALEAALDVSAAATTLARLSVPRFADFCLVDLLRTDGSLLRSAVAHALPGLESALEPGLATAPDSATDMAPGRAVRTGEVECVSGAELSLDTVSRRLGIAAEAGVRSCMIVPVIARERVLGAVTFGFTNARHFFDPLHVMTARDLAARAGLALDNSQLYETARSAVQSRNEVLGIVSHDLRVPLNTIVATLSLLSDSMADRRADVRGWFEILGRATGQIEHLITDLLDVSRIESNHFNLQPSDSRPDAMVAEACDALRHLATARNITIETELESDLPHVAVDAPKVVRVIGNLLGNAIKFSPPGGTIRVRAAAVDGELQISVHDDGPGIPPDQVQRVFDRFWQARQNDRRGSGLGLSIARGIVEAHGGRIWVDTDVGDGSTFTFAIPISNGANGSPRTLNVDAFNRRMASDPAPFSRERPWRRSRTALVQNAAV